MEAASPVGVGAVVLFSSRVDACVAFYRALGVPLTEERHGDDDPLHYACELGDVHLAVVPAETDTGAPALRAGGCSFVGYAVQSVDGVVDTLRQLGTPVVENPADYPWGRRAVVHDPDGRPVEVFERGS